MLAVPVRPTSSATEAFKTQHYQLFQTPQTALLSPSLSQENLSNSLPEALVTEKIGALSHASIVRVVEHAAHTVRVVEHVAHTRSVSPPTGQRARCGSGNKRSSSSRFARTAPSHSGSGAPSARGSSCGTGSSCGRGIFSSALGHARPLRSSRSQRRSTSPARPQTLSMLASFFSGECPAECVPFRPRSLPHAVGRLASPYVYRGRGRRPGATTLIGYKPQRSSATMPRVLVDPPAAADGLLELLREGATRFAARAARGNGHALHGLAERLSTPLCNAPRAVPKKKGQRSQADAARAKRTPHAPSGRRRQRRRYLRASRLRAAAPTRKACRRPLC